MNQQRIEPQNTPVPSQQVLRLGLFEAHLRTRDLRKHKRLIKLQPRPFLTLTLLLLMLCCNLAQKCEAQNQPGAPPPNPSGQSEVILEVGYARLQIQISGVTLDLPIDALVNHIKQAAEAVSNYYGRFPVKSALIRIIIIGDKHGVLQGTTWGDREGYPAVTRFRIGQHTTIQELREDWMATHELVHMALPSLPDEQHWFEEGLATYVEPLARAQLNQLTPQEAWDGMLDGMPKGEPGESDQGLDRTHTWGRTYWGGALFCLVAEVELRKKTSNKRGLRDALRAVVEAGGTIDNDWPIAKVMHIGDKATGTTVLADLYKKWSVTPVTVDLPQLWNQLGVHRAGDSISFDENASLARIRENMTSVQGGTPLAKPSRR